MQPRVVGKYRIEASLGEGGFGDVYVGVHTETGRRVAIKSIVASRDLERTRALLLREADVLRRVASRHPAFVQVYEVVVGDAGELFLVRELVEGVDLAQWQSGRSEREIVTVYATIADALATLHESQVAFRDLKPSNVLMDEAQQPRLVDFGLAVELDAPDPLTAEGSFVGTPLYLAPEVIRGQRADARSDVYALGVMLLEALEGVHPLEHAGSIQELLMKILAGPPLAALQQLRGGSAARLEPLIAAMLAPQPERRPGAREVALELRTGRLRRGHVPAESLRPTERAIRYASRPERRSGPGWIGVGVICAALGSFLAFAGAGWAVVLWALAFGAAAFGFVLLLGRYRRIRLQRRMSLREALGLRQRIGALEQRLAGTQQLTQSIVIGAEQIKADFDDAELERLLRRSLIVQLADTASMDPARLLLALHYLGDAKTPREKPSLVLRLTPWVSLLGAGTAALVAGAGLLSSLKLLTFDEPPKIRSLQPLAAKVALGGEIDLLVDAEDPEHQPLTYEYHAGAGTIRGESKLATLRVPEALDARSIAVRVLVRDPAGHVATDEVAVRINRRPQGRLSFSPEPVPGVPTRVQASVTDGDGDALRFQWFARPSIERKEADGIVYWQLPSEPGVYEIGCQVSDGLETLELRRRFEQR
jgi:hypothetical protein